MKTRFSDRRRFAVATICAAVLASSRAIGATIDITSYGAIAGDGKNDAAAINSAIAAAQAGDTVRFPAGTFEISATIQPKSGVKLIGAGIAASSVKFIGNQSTSLLTLDGVSNVELGGIAFDGNNSTNASQGIVAQNSSKLAIHDIKVANLGAKTGFGPHGVYFSSAVTDSTIQNSQFSNIGTASSWGAGIRIGQTSPRNSVLSNTITDTGRGGILCDNNSTDLVIRKNTVTGSGKKDSGIGIELWSGCHRSIVEDNKIDHWLSVDSSNNLAIRRNVVSDKTGVYKYTGLELVDSTDNVFTDNTVDSGQKIGISISGPGNKSRILFAGNDIKAASTWGVQIQGETGTANRMYFYKNNFSGMLRNDANTLYPPEGHGIRFNGDSNHIVFDSNTSTANQGQGIQALGPNLSFLRYVNNTITNNGQAGITFDATPNMTWLNNTLSGNLSNTAPPVGVTPPLMNLQIVPPAQAVAQDDLSFSFQLSGAAGLTASNVLWDFGDGLPSTALAPTHTFARPGTYRVTLLAWDAAGEAAMSQMNLEVSPTTLPEPATTLPVIGAATTFMIRHARRRD